jgi:hypothetical protein
LTPQEESSFPTEQLSHPPQSIPLLANLSDQLHLTEKKVFVALDVSGDRDLKQWVFDTGASNHMSESRAAFADLDTDVNGSMRFGDGFITRIEGLGTVIFSCKNDKHRALPNVYFLPRLTANIVSVKLLNESGYQVHVEDGVCASRMRRGVFSRRSTGIQGGCTCSTSTLHG